MTLQRCHELKDRTERELEAFASQGTLTGVDGVELLELLELAGKQLVSQQKAKARLDRHRCQITSNRKILSRKPLNTVGKAAPPPPVMPTTVPVAQKSPQAWQVDDIDIEVAPRPKAPHASPVSQPSSIAAILSRLPTAKKVDLTSPQ